MPDNAYANRLARSYLLAAQEIIGVTGTHGLLDLAGLSKYVDALPPDDLKHGFSFKAMSKLQQAFEDLYGSVGARGLLLRTGMQWLGSGLADFGAFNGLRDPAFQALARPARIHLGLTAVADVFTHFSDQKLHLELEPGQVRLVIENSAIPFKRSTGRPTCAAMEGLCQEVARWASNGYDYPVHETACMAAGAPACVIVVGSIR